MPTDADNLMEAVQSYLPDTVKCFSPEVVEMETMTGNHLIFKMQFTSGPYHKYVSVFLDAIFKGELLHKWAATVADQIQLGLTPCP